MKKLSDIKLKYQLILLILTALFMMTVSLLIYYLTIHSLTRSRANIYFEGYASQLQNKVVSDITDIENVAKTLSVSFNLQKYLLENVAEKKYLAKDYVIDSMNYAVSSSNSILSIRIIDRRGTHLSSGTADQLLYFNNIIQDYGLKNGECTKPFFTKCYMDKNTGNAYYAYIVPIYTVLEGYDFSKDNLAACIILCSSKLLQKNVNEIKTIPGLVFMISENDLIISSNISESDNQHNLADIDMAALNSLKQGNIDYNGSKYVKRVTHIDKNNWDITCLIKVTELTKDLGFLKILSIAIMCITAILLLIIGIKLTNSISAPITQIVNDMKIISEKSNKSRIAISSKNEIGVIAHDINLMLDKIDDITSRVFYTQNALYESEIEKKQAELAFYQNQINPHFLYNTLECIRSMATFYKADEIANISNSMARMFRYSVKEGSSVTIESELNCVNDYFNVMTIRYMRMFKLKQSIDDKIKGYKIQKMTLQPIIENAIVHGLTKKTDQNAYLCIKGYLDENSDIIIKIVDNGNGISEIDLAQMNKMLEADTIIRNTEKSKGGGMGLYNINRRLKLSYGSQYGLSITSKPGYYTAVTIVIPGIL